MRCSILIFSMALTACGGTAPCSRFEPYEDVVSGRLRTEDNAGFLDAMSHYRSERYAEAAPLLSSYVDLNDHEPLPRLYLASTFLVLGKPYEAELQLDLIERDDRDSFRDHVEWYRVMCHVCSGQEERARAELKAILARPRHTYRVEAEELLNDLRD